MTGPLLEELGCNVFRAANGREAVSLFEREHRHVDLVLLDLTMPDQSGLDVLETLRSMDPEVRVILTSGFGIESAGGVPLAQWVAGFVPKPHAIANLEAAIWAALEAS